LIDGQDIAEVTAGKPAHASIGGHAGHFVVAPLDPPTTSATGKPNAGEADLVAAAQMAHAHDFILDLEDQLGRQRL